METADAATESGSQRVADRYTVMAELGAGGMGKVYDVVDERTGRRLALKQLHAALARGSDDHVALFKREYYTLKQLSHPLIVEVYEYGVDDSGPFFTMELLSGRDLVQCAPLPWRETCRLLRDVASALAMLHSRGLVYRDLSARNVRVAADGQAKLLDFGAMASRDVPQTRVVGTPPFIAPEALHGQPLDARTDLYALGALGYFMLSRQHAYPAHRLEQLRDTWRSAPRPLAALGVPCPAPLNELVLSLLSLDPRARPPHAAEVIDRLGALADLPPLPAASAARGYLNRPTLVGRARETLLLRKQLLRMLRGRGAAFSIEAEPGMGRTRLLEDLVLEAKLLGSVALHASARAGAPRYDVARQLGVQLLSALPEVALETAAPFIQELREIVPDLAQQAGASAPHCEPAEQLEADERWARAIAALVGWIDAVVRQRPLVIAVDDLQQCDDASSAVIAGLALVARDRRLVVAATLCNPRGAAIQGPHATFRAHAKVLPLPPLGAGAALELYRHIFGDVGYLPELASWAERIAKGSPQQYVALARDLVDRSVIRYADGVWVLPRDLEQQSLPTSLVEAFAQRLAGLSEAARDVAETLCVAAEGATPAACVAFCAHRDEASVFAALDELLAKDLLLLAEAHVYAFRQPAIHDAVEAQLDDTRRRACHRRIGLAMLERGPLDTTQRLHAARHLLRGGEDARGVECVLATVGELKDISIEIDPRCIEALELALPACERAGRGAVDAMRIRLTLLPCAFLIDHALVHHGLPAIDRLERDCGIASLGEQDPSKSLIERVVLALGEAIKRHEQTPEAERLFDPIRSVKELGKALLAVQAICSTQFDIERARACCARFEPLTALTPLAKLAYDAAVSALDALVGRFEPALALQQAVIVGSEELLARMEAAGEDPQQVTTVRALLSSIAYVVALRVVVTTPSETMRLADLIDRTGINRHKPGAAQLRVLASYVMGDGEAAARFQAEYERRLVRFRHHGSSGIDLSYRIQIYSLGSDLMALQALGREVEALCERRPGYLPFLHLCRGHTFRLRGQHERALAEYHEVVELAAAGKHQAWASGIGEVVRTLIELGRLDDARACVEHARVLNAQHALGGTLEQLLLPSLATLSALEGDVALATRVLHEAIEQAVRGGHPRLVRAELVGQMIRVALIARDRPLFEQHANALRELYRDTDHRGMHATYTALIERARAEGLLESACAPAVPEVDASERTRVEAAISACTDASSRAECALTLLAAALHSPSGYLFALRAGKLEVAAAPRDRPRPPKSMSGTLAAYLSAELAENEAATATSFDLPTGTQVQVFEDGRRYRPIVLRVVHDGQALVAGIAALEVDYNQAQAEPSLGLIEALSEQLIRTGDIQPEPGA